MSKHHKQEMTFASKRLGIPNWFLNKNEEGHTVIELYTKEEDMPVFEKFLNYLIELASKIQDGQEQTN